MTIIINNNSSIIDCNVLPSGVEVDNLPDTYVIFITEKDVLGKNKPIYHIDRYIKETEEYFNDGSHIIYVNAFYKDDTELGKLMHDFSVSNPDDMNYKELADATEYYKKDKEGVQVMCKAMEDFVLSDRAETVLRLLEQGILTKEQIAEAVEFDIETVNAIAEERDKSS